MSAANTREPAGTSDTDLDQEVVAVRAQGVEWSYRGGPWRWGHVEALRDCTFALPAGSVTALVGANGAGKSTLLALLAGLAPPDAGALAVRGRRAFVAQDKPLYRHLDALGMCTVAARLNRGWDQARARRWLDGFGVPVDRPCGRLSGGQRTLVALALAVGAAPDVLLLDEPLAELDPVVRREVTAELLDQAAEHDMTVVLSTHVVSDLVGVADHLLVLSGGRVLLAGESDDLQAEHRRWTGPAVDTPPVRGAVIDVSHDGRQSRFLLRHAAPDVEAVPEYWSATPLPLEELVHAYLSRDRKDPR